MQRSPGTSVQTQIQLEVLPMRRRHIKGIMAIEQEVYPRPWSADLFLTEIAEPANRAYFVGRVHRQVVAYGGVLCFGDEGHITTIAVHPDWHRHKIGTRVIYELIAAAIEMGARAISLEVRVSNWAAQRLYGEFGFRPVGVRKNYYAEIKEDALIMWVDDVQSADYLDRIEDIIEAVPDGVRPLETLSQRSRT